LNYEDAVFQLILHGGNARGEAYEALDAAEAFNFIKAADHLKEAEQEFLKGHQFQTKLIQSDDQTVPNFLMIHAQDHVMTAQAELNLIKHLITSYQYIKKLEERIEQLENQLKLTAQK
jgi:PTS system cellobiose-specific IIA component